MQPNGAGRKKGVDAGIWGGGSRILSCGRRGGRPLSLRAALREILGWEPDPTSPRTQGTSAEGPGARRSPVLREVPIEDFDRLLAGAPTSPAFDNVLARTRTISDAPIAGISTRLSRGARCDGAVPRWATRIPLGAANGLDRCPLRTNSHGQMAVAANVIPERGSAPLPTDCSTPGCEDSRLSVVLCVAGWPACGVETADPGQQRMEEG